jgi:hypothetical protein
VVGADAPIGNRQRIHAVRHPIARHCRTQQDIINPAVCVLHAAKLRTQISINKYQIDDRKMRGLTCV